MRENWQRVFNPRTEISWGAWRTHLGELAVNGWEVSVEEFNEEFRQRLYIKQRGMEVVGVSDPFYLEDHAKSLFKSGPQSLSIVMRLANRIDVAIPTHKNVMDRDYGRSIEMGFAMRSLDDLHIFHNNQPEEIIVEPQTVSEMLDKIRNMQSDKAREILKQQRLDEGGLLPDRIIDTQVSAKILTFAA